MHIVFLLIIILFIFLVEQISLSNLIDLGDKSILDFKGENNAFFISL
jgi:hypothetical protein